MYTLGEKIFCCQGHPEFTKEIMEVMLTRVGDSLAEGAEAAAVKLFGEVESEPEPLRLLARRLLAGGTLLDSDKESSDISIWSAGYFLAALYCVGLGIVVAHYHSTR